MESRYKHGVGGVLLLISLLMGSSIVYGGAPPVVTAPEKREQPLVTTDPSAPITLTMTISAGYLTGESTELVYWPQVDNHKASELTWQIDSLFMVGINASLQYKKWVKLNFDGWFKATDGEATMDDYDWQNPGGDWTDWSHHEDTDVTDGSMIDVNAEVSFYQNKNVILAGIVGFKRDNYGWESKGGDYTYSINGFRDSRGSFDDDAKAIGYEQTFSSVYFGLGFTFLATDFECKGRMIYSPIVQGEATDNHYMRNLVTYDDADGGDMIAFDISGSYYFTTSLAVKLAFSYQKYDTMQGDTQWHYNNYGLVYNYDDGAGMDHTSSLISLGLVLRL